MKHKIFDCITFFRENEQFLLRFNILNKYVDYFVICESLQDHQGKKKKINFNFKPFLKFKKKIIYLILKEFPNKKMSPWQRQAFQREFIFNGLKNAKNDDYIMFSDPDEIPRPEKLLNLELKKKYGIFMQNSYCYKFNLFNRYESPWEGTRICRKKDLKSFNWLRQKIKKKNLNYPFYRIDKEKDICTFKDGGWHFNSLMSPKEISIKLKTFAHTEYSLPKFSSVLNIKKRIANLQDLFGRGHKYKKIKIDESFPLFLRRNKRRYKKFII